jgi:4-aminobutyrate aminotransferase-like enzyme
MLVLEGAYHGNVISAVDISPYKFNGPGGAGAPEWVHPLPLPCAYRGRLRAGGRDLREVFVEECESAIQRFSESASQQISNQQTNQPTNPLAGFISESIIGTGGQVVFPEGYLSQVYQLVRAAGGVCIADEVQHGFGRVGTHFWGFEQHGVIPDIVTMGKPFGNGHPLAAVVTTREIAAAFHNGMEYFNTFGGSPVSCAVGLAVMEVIEEEGLQAHALEVGDFWKAGLEDLKGRYPLIGDVRGSGLFLGVELVRDRETLEPADKEASEIVERMKDQGILLSTDGPWHNVIKIKPPMVITKEDVGRVVEGLGKQLEVMSNE